MMITFGFWVWAFWLAFPSLGTAKAHPNVGIKTARQNAGTDISIGRLVMIVTVLLSRWRAGDSGSNHSKNKRKSVHDSLFQNVENKSPEKDGTEFVISEFE